MLKKEDYKQIEEMGISKEEIAKQLDSFKNGFPYMNLVRPATEGDGIIVLDKSRQEKYENFYRENKSKYSIVKFVPASGAASRMFKDLFTFLNNFDLENDEVDSFIKKNKLDSVKEFFDGIEHFAFYDELMTIIKGVGINFSVMSKKKKYITILEYLLTHKGLNYGMKPKGLLAFHFYFNRYRTAVSEHLVEGARYATAGRKVNVHFTISKEHKFWFEELVDSKLPKYQRDFNVIYNVTYSYQSHSTDTIAVTPNNKPLRDESGKLVFRPGGHGALIENLNNLKEDIIFIKNVDNVVPDHFKENTIRYKRIIAGLMLNLKRVINNYHTRLVTGDYHKNTLVAIEDFCEKKLNIVLHEDYYKKDIESKVKYIQKVLNRPLRVCGMVKNEGEPGGGPFWVKDEKGKINLQIVEGSQMDLKDAKQKEIVSASTHFNPVDIVCTFKDWSGESLDLNKFIDEKTGFISEKSKDGVELKALERPGLWNGAMSDWITIFVEVPAITFNPVKTINDLLRPEHQALTRMNEG
jgi:hypothetical protein